MINVSDEFKQQIANDNRLFYVTADCILADGTELHFNKEDFYQEGNGFVESADSSDFPIGVAIEKTATLNVVNDDDRFSQYIFTGARFTLYLNLDWIDGTNNVTESARLGTYIVIERPTTAEAISMTLADHMYLADKEYDTTLSFPTTAYRVLRNACQDCNIMMQLDDEIEDELDSIRVWYKPQNTTYRQVIGGVAMFVCGNARIDEYDYLRIIQFNTTVQNSTGLDGGIFDNGTPKYTSGDSVDGGGLVVAWQPGDTYDAGDGLATNYHFLRSLTDLSYDFDDTKVTGVFAQLQNCNTYTGNPDDNTLIFSVGTSDYSLELTSNPVLLTDYSQVSELFTPNDALLRLRDQCLPIYMKVKEVWFRAFSCTNIAYPLATFLDPTYFIDTKGNVYFSYITDIEFTFLGATKFANKTKTITKDTVEFSGDTNVVLNDYIQNDRTYYKYEAEIQHLQDLSRNATGYFITEEVGSNNEVITYWHSAPILNESKYIKKICNEGIFISSDYGQTWRSGIDFEGNTVFYSLVTSNLKTTYLSIDNMTLKSSDESYLYSITDDGEYYQSTPISIGSGSASIHLDTHDGFSVTTFGGRDIKSANVTEEDINPDITRSLIWYSPSKIETKYLPHHTTTDYEYDYFDYLHIGTGIDLEGNVIKNAVLDGSIAWLGNVFSTERLFIYSRNASTGITNDGAYTGEGYFAGVYTTGSMSTDYLYITPQPPTTGDMDDYVHVPSKYANEFNLNVPPTVLGGTAQDWHRMSFDYAWFIDNNKVPTSMAIWLDLLDNCEITVSNTKKTAFSGITGTLTLPSKARYNNSSGLDVGNGFVYTKLHFDDGILVGIDRS